MSAYTEISQLKEEIAEKDARILQLILERDRWRQVAEEKLALRREVEELLGIESGPASDEQFQKGLDALRKALGKDKDPLKCCILDIEDTIEGKPDACVFDVGNISDCIYADVMWRECRGSVEKSILRNRCRFWRP